MRELDVLFFCPKVMQSACTPLDLKGQLKLQGLYSHDFEFAKNWRLFLQKMNQVPRHIWKFFFRNTLDLGTYSTGFHYQQGARCGVPFPHKLCFIPQSVLIV